MADMQRLITDKLIRSRLVENNQDKSVRLNINDSEGQITKLLEVLESYTNAGHSFHVIVDPEGGEYEQRFFIDGDGADKLSIEEVV